MSEDPALIPSDPDAERRVIGSLLLEPALIAQVMKALSSTDFYVKRYGWLLNACCDLWMSNDPVNVETVARRLDSMSVGYGKNALEEMGGMQTVAETVEGVLAEECSFWIDRVSTKAMEREAFFAVSDIRRKLAAGGTDIKKLLSEHEAKLAAIARGRGADSDSSVTLEDADLAMDARLHRLLTKPDAIAGMETGFRGFDSLIDGVQPGNMYIFYAPTSRYKSQIVDALGLGLSRNGYRGRWFTTEMTHLQAYERLVQMESGVNILWSRRDHTLGDHMGTLMRARQRLKTYPIGIVDKSNIDIGVLRADALRLKKWEGLDYVIIDLMDKVSTPDYKDNSVAKQEVIMDQLSSLAKDAEIGVLVTTHVSKPEAAIKRNPVLDVNEMKGSSSKGQDVAVAVSLMVVDWDPVEGEWYALTRDEIRERNRPSCSARMKVLAGVTKNRYGDLDNIMFEVSSHEGLRVREISADPWMQEQPELAATDDWK